jgi:GAF domain-containing protein
MNLKRSGTQQSDLSLQTIIALNIIAIATVAVALISIIIYFNVRQNLEDQFSKRVLNLAALAALAQQGDLHSTLKNPADEKSANYQEITRKNFDILNSDPIIGAIYTMRRDEKKNIYFVVYTGQNRLAEQGKTNPNLGEVLENPSPLLQQEFATMSAPEIETNEHADQWGNWVSAYAPFYRNDGQIREGVIGIDINKNALAVTETNFILLILGIFIAVIPILVLVGWAISQRISRPITSLTNTILGISTENFNQPIAISGNKEIEQASQAINNILMKIGVSSSKMKEELFTSTNKTQEHIQALEQIKIQAEKQTKQLKALAFVARAILSISSLDNLLLRIASTVSDTLSFYHIGIFLLDDAKEYAILTATNSAGGQRMIERNHRLKVGEEGIVGYVAGIGRPRIALDTDKDGVFLGNPDLPHTHSELTVPLKIGLDIIGVLDVQSEEPSAFTEEDVEVFSILADYISIAIQNAQRFQEIQKTITESDTLYRNYLRQEWKSFANQRRNPGYLYSISGSKPLIKKLETLEIQKAIQSGKPTISQEKTQSHLSVPIKLRGQVIGILNIQSGGNHSWEEDEIDIATAVADRVGLAVENARLLEDSQSRAARERTIGEITSKIGASINIRNVLQTAVEELGHILPGSDVIIQLQDTKNKE